MAALSPDLMAMLGGGSGAPAGAGSSAAPSGADDDKGLSSFSAYIDDMIADAKAAHDMADDAEDASVLTKVLAMLQGIKATEQKENDAAIGGKVSPRVLRKTGAGGGY